MVTKKQRKAPLILAAVLALSTITGCSYDLSSVTSLFGSKEEVEEEQGEYSFDVVGETSTLGISSSDSDFLEKLENNTYYVVHNDVYYPVYFYKKNDAADEDMDIDENVDDKRLLFYTTENEVNIPTFYEGDKLVYYSTDTLLDYITWERFYDMGYTIGVNGIQSNIAGRCYIDLTSEDLTILPDGPLADAGNTEVDEILFDKIGGTQLTEDFLDHGIIYGIEKDQTYDVELYEGTQFNHYDATGNYHAFHSYERFASVNYKTLQDFIYDIEIPEYFVNGYYTVNNTGIFRYVKGKSYDSDTDFNEQLLYQYKLNRDNEPIEDEWVSPFCYSEFEELNYFTSHKEGTLGYTPLEDGETDTTVIEDDTEEENPEEENKKHSIQQSIVKTFDLWAPKDKVGTIKIVSNDGEKTGNIIATFSNGKTKKATYDFITGEYVLEVNGKDEKFSLSINGFFKGYKINLTNIEQYTGQDGGTVTEATEVPVEDTEVVPEAQTEAPTEAVTEAPAPEETAPEATEGGE